MKKQLMMVAWSIAEGRVAYFGGKASDYISFGMKRAWIIQKEGRLEEMFNKKFGAKIEVVATQSTPVLKGRMTEKQESFIASLLRTKSSDNSVAQAFDISSLRSTITKAQASQLISELLAA